MKIAIIGAGITGLVAARRLGIAGHEVDVYERWPGLGGQVATLELGEGDRLEHYYHHLFTTDREIAALYEELGMDDAIEWLPSTVAVFVEGRSWPLASPLDLLRFQPLPLHARLRMGLSALRLQRRRDDHAAYEGVTARDWIEQHMGPHAWRVIWGPLLEGKFGRRAGDISMAWLWSKMTLRRGDERRQEVLGYPRHGWQPLLERLREEIEGAGGRVLIDRPAAGIERNGNGFELAWGPSESFRQGLDPRDFERAGTASYDRVIATVGCRLFERLLGERLTAEAGEDYIRKLRSIDYHEALCVVLELDRQFTPYYWTNISEPGVPFIGLIEQTNFIPPERYGGRHFLYVANYLEPGDELLELESEALLDRYEPALRQVNPSYSREWVKRFWVYREPDAQPIVDLGYHERIPPLRTGAAGLLLANTAQVYPQDRGTNYAVKLGEEVAAELLAEG